MSQKATNLLSSAETAAILLIRPGIWSTRTHAKAMGWKRYFTGKACRNGHIAERITSTGKCAECHRLRRVRRYQANPERERQKKAAYDEKNRELINARARAANAKNPERNRASTKRWRLNNIEDARASCRDYYWKNADRERLRAQIKRARRAIAEGFFTEDDHIIAIANSGTNWPRNLQFLCQPCNLKKNAKDPLRFAREEGLLL